MKTILILYISLISMLCFTQQIKAQMQPPPPCTVPIITIPTNDVQNGSTPLTFTAIDYVQASNTITTNFVGGADITYEAGKAVTLTPGFKTHYGTTFEARIAPCSNPNPAIDLEVDLYAIPEPSDPNTYLCTFVVFNNSNVTATGVKAQFTNDPNANVVAYGPASGTTYDMATGVWDIGSIPPNSSIIMDIFLETMFWGDPLINFGQVTAANEVDIDSTPNNSTGGVTEDDEADAIIVLPPPPPFAIEIDDTPTAKTADTAISQNTVLSQISCYPNPFAEQTNIVFTLSEASDVSVIVSDITGKQIAILLDKQSLETGNHQISFEAQGLPNGTYIYSIHTNNTTTSQRMILNQ